MTWSARVFPDSGQVKGMAVTTAPEDVVEEEEPFVAEPWLSTAEAVNKAVVGALDEGAASD